MPESVEIEGVEIFLSEPDTIENMEWIGGEVYMGQLLAAWTIIDKKDIPLNPQILGKPGVGKTTLAYTAAKKLDRPAYIFQATVDTRPEDLLISPVIAENNTIKYHASPLVTAMIKGGICILDEGNRMAEKSWASLAPLLDSRRYIESIIAGIKVQAHPDFRICVTMNDDSSTFEVPEYIHSRLQPQVFIEFPEREEEFQILQFNLPFARDEIIKYTVNFLQRAHEAEKIFTVRDGINICRYYMKMEAFNTKAKTGMSKNKEKSEKSNTEQGKSFNNDLFEQSVYQVLGDDGLDFLLHRESKKKGSINKQFRRFMDGFETDEDDMDDDDYDDENEIEYEDEDEDDIDEERREIGPDEEFDEDDFPEDFELDAPDPKSKGSKRKWAEDMGDEDDFMETLPKKKKNPFDMMDDDSEDIFKDEELNPIKPDDVLDIVEKKSKKSNSRGQADQENDSHLSQNGDDPNELKNPDEMIRDFLNKTRNKRSGKSTKK